MKLFMITISPEGKKSVTQLFDPGTLEEEAQATYEIIKEEVEHTHTINEDAFGVTITLESFETKNLKALEGVTFT